MEVESGDQEQELEIAPIGSEAYNIRSSMSCLENEEQSTAEVIDLEQDFTKECFVDIKKEEDFDKGKPEENNVIDLEKEQDSDKTKTKESAYIICGVDFGSINMAICNVVIKRVVDEEAVDCISAIQLITVDPYMALAVLPLMSSGYQNILEDRKGGKHTHALCGAYPPLYALLVKSVYERVVPLVCYPEQQVARSLDNCKHQAWFTAALSSHALSHEVLTLVKPQNPAKAREAVVDAYLEDKGETAILNKPIKHRSKAFAGLVGSKLSQAVNNNRKVTIFDVNDHHADALASALYGHFGLHALTLLKEFLDKSSDMHHKQNFIFATPDEEQKSTKVHMTDDPDEEGELLAQADTFSLDVC